MTGESVSGNAAAETAEARPQGARWLDMVGRGHLENLPTNIVGKDGQPLPVGRFDETCEDHVRPLFEGLELARQQLGEGTHTYLEYVADAQALVDGYLVRFGVDPSLLEPPVAAQQ